MIQISLIIKLKNESTKQVQEVDPSTGEIFRQTVTTTKVYSAKIHTEEFYITFINALSKIVGLTRMLDVKVLAVLCTRAEFNTGTVQLTPFIRESVCTELDISYNSLANALTSLKKKNFIQIYKGNCIINPLFFWKGDLKTRDELLRNSELSFTINFSH